MVKVYFKGEIIPDDILDQISINQLDNWKQIIVPESEESEYEAEVTAEAFKNPSYLKFERESGLVFYVTYHDEK